MNMYLSLTHVIKSNYEKIVEVEMYKKYPDTSESFRVCVRNGSALYILTVKLLYKTSYLVIDYCVF